MNLLFLMLFCQTPALESPGPDNQVVAFLGVECPLAGLYARRLNELRIEFPQIQFTAFAPNLHDSDAEVAEFQERLDFPIRKSAAEAIRLGAKHSPEVFLIHAGHVVYSGRIDDQYEPGVHRPAPTRRDLALAIEDVLAGRSVSVPRVEPVGCHLNIETPLKSRAEDALAVIHAKCSSCHHAGTAAPFSLLSYDDARAWHATIRDMVEIGRMPPWRAEVGKFANDRRLSLEERRTLLAWVDAGCPDGKHVAPPVYSSNWSFEPDVVQETPTFQVPAAGTLDYQEFRLPVFSRDTWISAVEMRGSRAVHHINALLEPAEADSTRRYAVGGDQYLATMVAGNPGIRLPADTAKLIPANWRIRLEVHYEPIGRSVLDQCSIALKLAKKPRRRVSTRMLLKPDIVLAPNALTTFQNEWRLETDYTLLAIFPHMHLRGKSMRVEACLPGQPAEVLLDVPQYDYAWQDRYELAEPRQLPAGTLIRVTATWDNTSDNPLNPDPHQTVHAGKLATDEMFQCSLDVYETRDSAHGSFAWLPIVAIGLAHTFFRLRKKRVASRSGD